MISFKANFLLQSCEYMPLTRKPLTNVKSDRCSLFGMLSLIFSLSVCLYKKAQCYSNSTY